MTKFVVNFSKYPAIHDIMWTFLTEGGLPGPEGVVHTYETDPDDFEKKMSDMSGRIEVLLNYNMKNLQGQITNWHEVMVTQFATAELYNFEQDFLLMAEGARRGETNLCNLTI